MKIAIALFLLAFFALSTTLGYYFYSDDYSMLYHLQNNIRALWPYQFVPLTYKPIYHLFDLNPIAYSLAGVLTYAVLAVFTFQFYYLILKNKLISFLSSALFATAYIGIDQFTQLAVSAVNNLSNILILLTLVIYLRFIQTNKKFYYFIVFGMFIFLMIVFPFRVFSLLLFMPAIHFLLTFELKVMPAFKRFISITILQIPFLAIAYFAGIFSYGSPETETIVPNFILWKSIFVVISPGFLSEIPRIIGRFLVPESVAIFLFKTVYLQTQYFLIGSAFILASLFFGIYFYSSRTYQKFARGILIFLVMTIGGYIGNLLILPNFDSNGPVNRYLNLSFIGYSVLFSTLMYVLISNITKKIHKDFHDVYVLLMLVFVVSFSALSISYEKNILSERSIPSKKFFRELMNFVPYIPEKTFFYFDYADYHPIYSRFGNIMVGAYLPRETALAVHYKKELKYIKIPNSFNEFLAEIKRSPDQKNYTFYYDEKGLKNTTNIVSDLLKKGEEKNIVSNTLSNLDPFESAIKVIADDVFSGSSYKLNFSLQVSPIDSSFFNFPYSSLKKEDPIINEYKKGKINKSDIFDYLSSRKNYYDKVSVKVSSSHIYGTKPAEHLIDDRSDTYWLDDQSSYVFGLKPWIEIDLGEEREIGKILWINESEPRFPKKFKIDVSSDKVNWKTVKIKKRERLEANSLLESISFSPIIARFVKITIYETVNFEPAFSEVEIIGSKFSEVDLLRARRIKENPFEYILDTNDLSATYDFLRNNSTLTIQTLTNKEKQISDIYDLKLPIQIDGLFHEYSIEVPPRGIMLSEIVFKMPFPAKMLISEINLEYIPFRNIK